MLIQNNVSLINLNTLHLNCICKYFVELNCIDILTEIHNFIKNEKINFIIIGDGSNIILPELFNGLVIYNKLLGKKIISQDSEEVIISAMAGENFNNFITYCLNNNYYGLENLSLIPGSIGATPIQNIGAYGSEIKNFIEYVIVYDLSLNQIIKLSNKDCNFEYRFSIFKLKKNYLVIEVIFKLFLTYKLNTTYAEVSKRVSNIENCTPAILRDIIIDIRKSKLPNPKLLPNVGSFFHNPKIKSNHLFKLKKQFKDISYHMIDQEMYKIPAGWLIDNLGLKGYKIGNVGVYEKQALILVNYSNATQSEILNLANYIQNKVLLTYDIKLEIEPEIIY